MTLAAPPGFYADNLVWVYSTSTVKDCDGNKINQRGSLTSTLNVIVVDIEFISFRENIDTGGPLGRAIVVIIGAIAELERNLIVERLRAGMRRARLEGRHIGRRPLDIDRVSVLQHRAHGQSLGQIAKTLSISRATVARIHVYSSLVSVVLHD